MLIEKAKLYEIYKDLDEEEKEDNEEEESKLLEVIQKHEINNYLK